MTQQALGRRVLRLRTKLGISQMELALRCEMPATSPIGSLELGESNPTFETLKKLAKGLGIAVDELLSEQEPQTLYDAGMNKRIAYATQLTPDERLDLVDMARILHRARRRS
ncbi:MAG: helix-turn-helix transcriptional regulator [Christensenellaceae bacterium]|nr:helix-turn-helix transcriptional regulator [Christensenellaceae bacterium]MEA5070181.1 helix-turn-helix transcriptional regulator [Christensenellaceae bacterium]